MSSDLLIIVRERLPESLIFENLREILAELEGSIELGGELLEIPDHTELELVERILYETELEIGFRSHLRATIAVGGVESTDCGMVVPRICFAILYFTVDGLLITNDFLDPSSWGKTL